MSPRISRLALFVLWLIPVVLTGCAATPLITPSAVVPSIVTSPTVTPPPSDGTATPAIDASPAPTATTAALGLPNMLVSSSANVALRRFGSIEFVPVTLGTELAPDDLLMLHEGEAGIFCADERTWDNTPLPLVVGERTGVSCGVGRPPRPRANIATLRTRSGDVDTAIESFAILSPRSGWLLDDRPSLAWQAVEGTSAYSVTLDSDDGIERPSIFTDSTELPYPDAWASLEAEGASYRLIVAPQEGIVNDQAPGFSLLEANDQAIIRHMTQRLDDLALHESARALLLAKLYQSNGLRVEGVQLLKTIEEGDQLPAVQIMLGELYLEMGLAEAGAQAFTNALTMAQADGFQEFEATSLTGLGEAACLQRNAPQAQKFWSDALAIYAGINNQAKFQELDTLLAGVADQCQ